RRSPPLDRARRAGRRRARSGGALGDALGARAGSRLMAFAVSVVRWMADPVRWQGSDGIPWRVGEHLLLSAAAPATARGAALPLGILLGHTGRGAALVVNVTSVGRALPSLAVMALALPLAFKLCLGLGFWPTVVTLVPLGLPLVLLNSYAAVRAVDRDAI